MKPNSRRPLLPAGGPLADRTLRSTGATWVSRALAYAVIIMAEALRMAELRHAQWRNDEAIIWLHSLQITTAGRFPFRGIPSDLGVAAGPFVGIPSDLGMANGPAQMLPLLPATLLNTPYIAFVLVAALNVLAVAALYRLGRLWGGPQLGLAAAVLCAVSPWAVIHSRRLWGNDMLAPFTVLFVTALWRFTAEKRRWRLVEVGAWFAIVVQMYIAAVVHLVVLVAGLVLALWTYGRGGLRRLAPPALLAGLTVVVLTAGYNLRAFLPHVSDLSHAVRDTRTETPQPVGLPNGDGLRFLLRSVGSDGYQHYLQHAAGYADASQGVAAVGTLFAEALFIGGTVFLLCRLLRPLVGRSPRWTMAIAAPVLLLTWVFGLPIALLAHDAPVCACFLLPAYPGQYLIVALGAFAGAELAVRAGTSLFRRPARASNRAPVAASPSGPSGPITPLAVAPGGGTIATLLPWLLVAAVVASELGAAVPFFRSVAQYWPGDRYGLPYEWHGRIVDAVARAWQPGMSIVVSGHGELDGVLVDDIGIRLPQADPAFVDDRRWLTLPGAGQAPMIILLTPGRSPAHAALESLLQSQPTILRATIVVPGAGERFQVLQVPAAAVADLEGTLAPPILRQPVGVQFANDVQLDRYALAPRLQPNTAVPVALEWTVLRTTPYIPADSFYVHLVHGTDTTAALDAPFLPPALWRAGERLWTFGSLPIGTGAARLNDVLIGLYMLKGIDAREGVITIPATADGRPLSVIRQGPFVVQAARLAAPDLPTITADLAPGLALVDADVSATAGAGGTLRVSLQWQATSVPLARYTVFLHLLNSAGKLVAQDDVEPEDGSFPTSTWLNHEVVSDQHTVPLPAALPAGAYHLVIGVYPTGHPDAADAFTWPHPIRISAA